MKITESAIDVLLGKIRLREGDEAPAEEEGGDEMSPEITEQAAHDPDHVLDPQLATDTSDAVEEKPLEDEKEVEVIGEGQIPQDSSGVETENFDQLNPHGEVEIQFEQGNFNAIEQIPELVADKVNLVTKTAVPLVEKALIELLGASSMFTRKSANFQTAPSADGNVGITGSLVYQVQMWIGLDVERDDIAHDSQYIMNTLKPIAQQLQVSECSIDVSEGLLTISFSC